MFLGKGNKMRDKEFDELLGALEKRKGAEAESALEIPAPEIKAVKKHLGKTFYDRWGELGDG